MSHLPLCASATFVFSPLSPPHSSSLQYMVMCVAAEGGTRVGQEEMVFPSKKVRTSSGKECPNRRESYPKNATDVRTFNSKENKADFLLLTRNWKRI